MRFRPIRLVFVALALSSWLVGCGLAPAKVAGEIAPPIATTAPVVVDLGPDVSPDVVAELNSSGEVAVIDVREDWEFAEGHIPGAVLVPLGTLPDRVSEIPKDRPVVLVCRSGNRSGQAYTFLTQQGFDNVHNMTGGMNAWQAAGLGTQK